MLECSHKCYRNKTSGCNVPLYRKYEMSMAARLPQQKMQGLHASVVVCLCYPIDTMFAANASTPLPAFSGLAWEEGAAETWQECVYVLEPGPRCCGLLCSVQVQLGDAESVVPLKSGSMYSQQKVSCLTLRSELCAPRGCQMPTFLRNSHPTLKNSILSEKVQLSPEGNKLRCVTSKPVSGHSHSNIVITPI